VFLLAPRVLEILIGLIVLRFPPKAIERWVVLLGIGLALGALLSTMLIQRPIHAQLDVQGNTQALLSLLMATDWIPELPRIHTLSALSVGAVAAHKSRRALDLRTLSGQHC